MRRRKKQTKQTGRRERIVRVPFYSPSFVIAQGTSGNGGFTTLASASSSTLLNGFALDPFQIGGVPYRMASTFLQWRLKWVKLDYIPQTTLSGVTNTIVGPTSAPTYANRNFAWALMGDPEALYTTYTSILVSNSGVASNTAKRSSLFAKGGTLSSWRYTTTTTGPSPTSIDLRMVAPMTVRFAFVEASTTAAFTYGTVIISGLAEFRYEQDFTAPIGLSLSPPKSEEKKEDDEYQITPKQ